MSSALPIMLNDIGTIILVNIVNQDGKTIDLSIASVKQFIFRKPDRQTIVVKDGSFTTDGKDGQLQYITVAYKHS